MSLEIEDCTFQSKLEFVLKGRKKYPWAASVGIPNGSVDRMFSGKIPGPKTLGLIMHTENVSITWLTEGVGVPYLVRWCPTDEECRQYFDELLAFQEWTVHRLTDGGRIDVLVLCAPNKTKYKEKWVPYTEIHVLAGVGRQTLERLGELPSHRQTYAQTETVAAVASGQQAGTWDLIGEKGLLRTYQTVQAADLRAAEARADYEAEGGQSEEERRLIDLYRRLGPRNRIRLMDVGEAFLRGGEDRRQPEIIEDRFRVPERDEDKEDSSG